MLVKLGNEEGLLEKSDIKAIKTSESGDIERFCELQLECYGV